MVLNITRALNKQARIHVRRQAADKAHDAEMRAKLQRIHEQAIIKLDQKLAAEKLSKAHLELKARIQMMRVLEEKAGRHKCMCETCREGVQLMRNKSVYDAPPEYDRRSGCILLSSRTLSYYDRQSRCIVRKEMSYKR